MIELASLPDSLAAILRKPNASRRPEARANGQPAKRKENAWARAALMREVENARAAPEGRRNDELCRATFSLSQIVAGGGLDESEVRESLTRAALDAGLSEAETRATIASGFKAGTQHPRTRPGRSHAGANETGANPAPKPDIMIAGGHYVGKDKFVHRTLGDFSSDVIAAMPAGALFRRGGVAGEVAGEPIAFRPVVVDRARLLIEANASLVRWSLDDRDQPSRSRLLATRDHGNLVLTAALDDARVSQLRGISECPQMLADGRILTSEGFDAGSGLWLALGGLELPPIPSAPTRDDALQALELFSSPLEEFTFASPADRSVAICGMLGPLARPSYERCPLIAFSSPQWGAGKGLLIDTSSILATGRCAELMTLCGNEDENRKRLFAALLEARSILVVDNVAGHPLGGASLASMLTASAVTDRVLGFSRNATASTEHASWFATGANLQLTGDLRRRSLLCELTPPGEHPEQRKFKRPDLRVHVRKERAALLFAGLTMLRAYHAAGRPQAMDARPFGSFESWSALVRGCLVWLGQADPLETQARFAAGDAALELHAAVIDDVVSLRGLIDEGGGAASTAELIRAAEGNRDLFGLCAAATNGAGKLDGGKLGVFLRDHAGRPLDGREIVRANVARRATWAVRRVAP